MRRQKFYSFLLMASLCLGSLVAVSCGDDGDSDNTPANTPANTNNNSNNNGNNNGNGGDDTPQVAQRKYVYKLATNMTAEYLSLFDAQVNFSSPSLSETKTITKAQEEMEWTVNTLQAVQITVTSKAKSNIADIIDLTKSYAMPRPEGLAFYLTGYNEKGSVFLQQAKTPASADMPTYTGRQIMANLNYFAYNAIVSAQGEQLNVQNTNTTTYTEPVEVTAGDMIDLGLSVKWASKNVVTRTQDNGQSYFAWGETSIKNDYTWDTYKYYNGSTITKYNTTDKKSKLDPEDDVAQVVMGGDWRMPTKAEAKELVDKCKWTWVSYDGWSGYKVEGPNGNSIFLPAAGHLAHNTIPLYGMALDRNKYGSYWTSEVLSTSGDYPYQAGAIIGFQRTEITLQSLNARYGGCSVRAVHP